MPIQVTCPGCQESYDLPDRYAGRAVACPGCKTPIKVPAAELPPLLAPIEDAEPPLLEPIEDETPRRRRSRQPEPAGSMVPLVLGGVGCGGMVLAGVVAAVWLLTPGPVKPPRRTEVAKAGTTKTAPPPQEAPPPPPPKDRPPPAGTVDFPTEHGELIVRRGTKVAIDLDDESSYGGGDVLINKERVALTDANTATAVRRDTRTRTFLFDANALGSFTVQFVPKARLPGGPPPEFIVNVADRVPELKQVRQFKTGEKTTRRLMLTGDGKTLLVWRFGEDIQLWDVATGKPGKTVVRKEVPVIDVALTPDGKAAVYATTDDTLHVWDVATGKERAKVKCPGPLGVAVSADGRTAAVLSFRSGGVGLYNIADGKETGRLKEDVWTTPRMMFGGGRLLVPGLNDGLQRLAVWDVEKKTRVDAGLPPAQPTTYALSPDGRTVLFPDRFALLGWDVAGRKERFRLPNARTTDFAFLGGGSSFAAVEGGLQVRDSATGRMRAWLRYPEDGASPAKVAASADGSVIALADQTGGDVWIVDGSALK